MYYPLDGTNRLHLKITPTLDEPPFVEDYHVPIFTCTKEDIENITWDLTIEQVHVMHLHYYPTQQENEHIDTVLYIHVATLFLLEASFSR